MDDQHELERKRELPAFEQDDERTVGGGLMSEGGTATDRGTGDLGGDGLADDDQDVDDDEEPIGGLAGDVAPGGAIALGPPAGGGAPYLAAYVDNDDDDKRND